MVKSNKQGADPYAENDLVFAKVRGYAPWPSRVLQVLSDTRFNVFFYGTHQSSIVKDTDLEPFNESTKSKYKSTKARNFKESLQEIEETPDIFLNFWVPTGKKSNTAKTALDPQKKRKALNENSAELDKQVKKLKGSKVEPDTPKSELIDAKELETKTAKQSKVNPEDSIKKSNVPDEKILPRTNTKSMKKVALPKKPLQKKTLTETNNEDCELEKSQSNINRRKLKKPDIEVNVDVPKVTLSSQKENDGECSKGNKKVPQRKNKIEKSPLKGDASETTKEKKELLLINSSHIQRKSNRTLKRSYKSANGTIESQEVEKDERLNKATVSGKVELTFIDKELPSRRKIKSPGDTTEVSADNESEQKVQQKEPAAKKSNSKTVEKKNFAGVTSTSDPNDTNVLKSDDLKDKSSKRTVKPDMPISVEDFLSSINQKNFNDTQVEILKREYELLNLDFELRKFLCIGNLDLEKAVMVMRSLKTFKFSKLHLLKNPSVEETLKLLTNFYEIPEDVSDKRKVNLAKEIRNGAVEVHKKIRKLFNVNDEKEFEVEYPNIVDNFVTLSKKVTRDARLLTEIPAISD